MTPTTAQKNKCYWTVLNHNIKEKMSMKTVFPSIGREFLDVFKSIGWRKWAVKLVVVIGIGMLMFAGCSSLNEKFGMKDDNPIEQGIEAVIKNKTGVAFDLTPGE